MPEKPRVLLIQPPIYDFALYDHFLKPYGLLRIGRWLAEAGWEVRFLNCLDYREPETLKALGSPARRPDGTGKFFRHPAELPADIKAIPRQYSRYGILPEVMDREIAGWHPHLALVTSGMTYWYPGVREAVRAVRKTYPDVPVAVGGTYASLMEDHCRAQTGAHGVFPGEAWDKMRDFLAEFRLPAPPVPEPETRAAGGPVPLAVPDLWSDAGVIRLNQGCPLSCDYCACRAVSGPFRRGDPEAAWRWVEELHKTAGTVNFAFYDDALLHQKEEIFLPFLERVLSSGLELNFYTPNGLHLNYLDRQIAEMMFRAGFREIRLGFESSSEEFHRTHDGKWGGDDFSRAFRELAAAGFRGDQIRAYVLAGLPGQEAAQVEESIRFARARGIRISIAEFSPVPGSPLWEDCVKTSELPLAEEPLYHNNCFFPMEWERFRREDLARLKGLCRQN